MYMDQSNRKRKLTAGAERTRAYGFHTFGDPGCPADFDGPFRENIGVFLQEFASREAYNVEGMAVWSIAMEYDQSRGHCVSMFVVEEKVQNASHVNPHCDQCRGIGWSHHLVSKSRYHFIIPAAAAEGEFKLSVLDMRTHLLHGMLHSNGFGHLISLNGREKGYSKFTSGREFMDLWDRICSMLRARKVSVEDVAKKRSMELRLLHCVAYGDSWFGRWGFKFGRGCYGVTQQMYSKAIEALRGMPLSIMLQHFQQCVDHGELVSIVALYQRLSGSVALQTVGNLMGFMMELKARMPLKSRAENAPLPHAVDTPCRWSARRLKLATQVIVEALKTMGAHKWVPRQDVRDAARAYIGDTGLLDFVLKSLANRVVGGHIVRRAVNPSTKVLEYCIQDLSPARRSGHVSAPAAAGPASVEEISRKDIAKHIEYIYRLVLERYEPAADNNSTLTAIPTASRIIFDTKHFVKDYRGEMTRRGAANQWGFDDDEMLRVMCTVSLSERCPTSSKRRRSPPPAPPMDVVVLPPHATVADLKRTAERALRETYYITRDFHAESISGLHGDNDDLLFGTLESGSSVVVQGSGIDMSSELRYEGGGGATADVDDWLVECSCGAKDDDGERMIACDVCGVWQHTRCAGIADVDEVPNMFFCHSCGLHLFQSIL
eukprot:PITA_12177